MADNVDTVPEQKAQIPFEDFIKLDLRVATVKAAEPHPNADRLIRIQLDDGTPDGRQVCAGIKGSYEPDDLVGRQVVVLANLEPRKIRGEISQGMILAGSDTGADGEKDVVLLTIDRALPAGSPVS